MDTRYAPREVEKKQAATFLYAPRHLRWLSDTKRATGLSKGRILWIVLDAAIRGEVARFDTEEVA